MPIPNFPLQVAPDWLIRMSPDRMNRDPLPLHPLLAGSLYYPSSRFDGDPVAYLGGNYLSFIYVDYSVSRKYLLAELKVPVFLGYRVLCHRPVLETELAPGGWSPGVTVGPVPAYDSPQRRGPVWTPDVTVGPVPAYDVYHWSSIRSPFCEWVVLERDPDRPESHGPDRFSFLYLCADGVAAFVALYIGNKVAPGAVAIIQPGHTGFGGNWTNFTDPDGPLAKVVMANPAGQPDLLLCGGIGVPNGDTHPCWPQYTEQLDVVGHRRIGVWRQAG